MAKQYSKEEIARLDARMAELDKYLRDPTLKLGRGQAGKLQFRKIDEQKKAVKVTPKTTTAAASASTATKTSKPTREISGIRGLADKMRAAGVGGKEFSRVGAGTIDIPARKAKAAAEEAKKAADREEVLKDIGSGLKEGIAAGASVLPLGRAIQGVRGLANMVRAAEAGMKSRRLAQRVRGAKEAFSRGNVTAEEAMDMMRGYKKGGKIKPGKVRTVMHEFKAGELKSSSGKKVTNPKQAMAIAMSEAGMKKRKYAEGGKVGKVGKAPEKPKKAAVPTGEEAELNPFGRDTVRVLTELKKKRGFARGGKIGDESKEMVRKEVAFMKKKGAPKSMIKHEEREAKGMKRGGAVKASDGCARKGRTKGRMV
jgi:hypothetical protein